MKHLVTILWISWTTMSFAQKKISFLDQESGEAISGVTVLLISLNSRHNTTLVTDSNGMISIDVESPCILKTSHLSYGIHMDTLSEIPEVIQLIKKELSLDEVVVTGQFQPQSIDESVFTVKTIDQEQIQAQGAVDLADVLSNNLNITLTPDKGEGRTSVSMLGLNGQYVKILVDGVPFISSDGNGNNVDISQINLNNVDRVEIVEGPMAVNYGANAVAGVINLISKGEAENSLYLQEETVGKEYGLSKGRHIQSLSLGHRFSDRLMINANYRRNSFNGFQNQYNGADYLENDGTRGYDWHPKLQHSGNARVSGKWGQHYYSYKLDLFSQVIDRYAHEVNPDEHVPTGTTNPYAFDQKSENNRMSHSLNLYGSISDVSYNILSSYSGVEIYEKTYRHRLLTEEKEEVTSENTSFYRSAMSRGAFSNIFRKGQIDIQPGYEYTYESIRSTLVREGRRKNLHTMAGYFSAEWKPFTNLVFRPGIRTIYNTLYPSPLIYSASLKYVIPVIQTDLRVSFGRSYRTPDLTELYFYFVDTNHDVQGNEELDPEDGHSLVIDIRKSSIAGSWKWDITLKAFYNDIRDQIILGIVNPNPLKYQYINIDRFKSQGFSLLQNLTLNQLSVNTGVSIIGRYNDMHETPDEYVDFLYSVEANGNFIYNVPQAKLSFAAFYKYTGSVEQFIQSSEDNTYLKGKTEAFNWLDFTTTWGLLAYLNISTGVKNILNITDVNTTAGQSDAHSAAPDAVGRSYGRSYFLKVAYDFGQHFNKSKQNNSLKSK